MSKELSGQFGSRPLFTVFYKFLGCWPANDLAVVVIVQ